MLMTHFIWQTVLKQLSVTNAKNGAITPSLTPTMQARCYNAGKWVTDRNGRAGLGWGGGRHRENVYGACSDCVTGGFGTRRPRSLETFRKRPQWDSSVFYYQVEYLNGCGVWIVI